MTESDTKASSAYLWLSIYSFVFAISLMNVLITIVVNAYNATRSAEVRKQLEGRTTRRLELAVRWIRIHLTRVEEDTSGGGEYEGQAYQDDI